jgi:hypothetical protein
MSNKVDSVAKILSLKLQLQTKTNDSQIQCIYVFKHVMYCVFKATFPRFMWVFVSEDLIWFHLDNSNNIDYANLKRNVKVKDAAVYTFAVSFLHRFFILLTFWDTKWDCNLFSNFNLYNFKSCFVNTGTSKSQQNWIQNEAGPPSKCIMSIF